MKSKTTVLLVQYYWTLALQLFEKRRREGQSRKCVGKTRSAEDSSPEKYCERALRRREYRRRRGITEKLTTQRRHEKLTKESWKEGKKWRRNRGKHKEHCNRLDHGKERRLRNWKLLTQKALTDKIKTTLMQRTETGRIERSLSKHPMLESLLTQNQNTKRKTHLGKGSLEQCMLHSLNIT